MDDAITKRAKTIVGDYAREWEVIDARILWLPDVLRGAVGRALSKEVYVVTDMSSAPKKVPYVPRHEHNRVLYVGQTKKGVANRLRQHIYTETPIGIILTAYMLDVAAGIRHPNKLNLAVIQVKGDLLDVETEYIRAMSPLLNGMRRTQFDKVMAGHFKHLKCKSTNEPRPPDMSWGDDV